MRINDVEKIEATLRKAHEYQKPTMLSPMFSSKVMREVRRIHASCAQTCISRLERFLLPWASVTCLAAMGLLIFGIMTHFQMENDIIALASLDTTGLLSTQFLGY